MLIEKYGFILSLSWKGKPRINAEEYGKKYNNLLNNIVTENVNNFVSSLYFIQRENAGLIPHIIHAVCLN